MRAPVISLDATLSMPLDEARVVAPIPIAARLGRYEVRGLLGEGGMGSVYEGFDPVLDRAVAIKVVRRDSPHLHEHAARLLREAVAMARLVHPNVVRVYDADVDRGESFVVMELVRGETLSGWTQAAPRGPNELILKYIDAGRGLAAAHEAGLVHRDFKPDNVLVGSDGRVLVTDFGLARPTARPAPRSIALPGLGPFATANGKVVGTPEFMAPEQWSGDEVDARADQYSFSFALWQQVRDVVDLSDRARRALLRGQASDPAARFASMHELLAAIAPDPSNAMRGTLHLVACGSDATRPGRMRCPA